MNDWTRSFQESYYTDIILVKPLTLFLTSGFLKKLVFVEKVLTY